MKPFRSKHRPRIEDEALVHYILGTALANQEREKVEHAYFTHNETFQRIQELELELVEAYQSGQLTGEQRKRVSDLIARSVKLQEHVRFIEALREAAFKRSGVPISGFRKWRSIIGSVWSVWKLASAVATILLITFVSVTWVIRHTEEGRHQVGDPRARRENFYSEMPQPTGRLRVFLNQTGSAAGQVASVRPARAAQVDFVLPVAPSDCTLRSLMVSDMDRHHEISKNLSAWYEAIENRPSYLVVSLISSNLKPGTWNLTEEFACGVGGETKTIEYRFFVIP